MDGNVKEKGRIWPSRELSAALEKYILLLQSFLPCLFCEWLQISVEKLGRKEKERGLDSGDIGGGSSLPKSEDT